MYIVYVHKVICFLMFVKSSASSFVKRGHWKKVQDCQSALICNFVQLSSEEEGSVLKEWKALYRSLFEGEKDILRLKNRFYWYIHVEYSGGLLGSTS